MGGFLVAVATVGAIAIASAGNEPDTIPVVVASGTIEPGTALGPRTLRVVEMALPPELVERTYADPVSLEGTIARSRVEDGELLQTGDVVESTASQRAAAPAREFALRLEAHRVAAGRLEAGDLVDVLATYGTGVDAVTMVVLHDVAVLAVETTDDSIGASRTVVLTLALDDRADTVALAHAVDVAALNVVRTTTAAPDEGGLEPYRPSSTDPEGGAGTDGSEGSRAGDDG